MALISLMLTWQASAAGPSSALVQDAYVWQRAWNENVRQAVADHAADFHRLVVLSAEVTWVRNRPHLIRVPIDYAALRAAGGEVGLALRIGPFGGPFTATGEPIESLAQVSAALLNEARTNQVSVSELQLDFDGADSKLPGYGTWVAAIRSRVAPTPLTITALPSWLDQPGFKELVAATDGYVLQVHSLERPKSPDSPFALCDPAAARKAVERAAQFGVPFRVALPTYGYLMAFDDRGQFVGLSAEGPSHSWPATVRTQEVRADPLALAHLVRSWTEHPPARLQGLIWYRLPVRADALNWPWPTLRAVMQGQEPRLSLRAQAMSHTPGLIDVELQNDGEVDIPLPSAVTVCWSQGRLLASDGLQGFQIVEGPEPRRIRFQSGLRPTASRLGPGGHCSVGWLRLSTNQEVQVEIITSPAP